MKFSDIRKGQWRDLQPYLDTCLLPLTGLTGEESPWEAADALERLGDLMAELEEPYKGRLVTYPALHYFTPPGGFADSVNQVCRQLKEGGFRYVVLVTADAAISCMTFSDADLLITNDIATDGESKINHLLSGIWQ
ncbi:DUF2487 family protein [Gorillibacterium massiliense]|uniref:DUF2487 family protein n=1 Tax=Gorillibacterium massiliense TaxID=1280390 RepID=UPI0004BB62C1|nr:DUF2487 family protein [Gorillibacterium massiliense]